MADSTNKLIKSAHIPPEHPIQDLLKIAVQAADDPIIKELHDLICRQNIQTINLQNRLRAYNDLTSYRRQEALSSSESWNRRQALYCRMQFELTQHLTLIANQSRTIALLYADRDKLKKQNESLTAATAASRSREEADKLELGRIVQQHNVFVSKLQRDLESLKDIVQRKHRQGSDERQAMADSKPEKKPEGLMCKIPLHLAAPSKQQQQQPSTLRYEPYKSKSSAWTSYSQKKLAPCSSPTKNPHKSPHVSAATGTGTSSSVEAEKYDFSGLFGDPYDSCDSDYRPETPGKNLPALT